MKELLGIDKELFIKSICRICDLKGGYKITKPCNQIFDKVKLFPLLIMLDENQNVSNKVLSM